MSAAGEFIPEFLPMPLPPCDFAIRLCACAFRSDETS